MARKKTLSDVRRLLLRHLYTEERWKVEALRDLVWDAVITRRFTDGVSVEWLAGNQPDRRNTGAVEAAIRREMYRTAKAGR